MTAVTGMGSGGDLVVLRPSPGGRKVAVHVVLSHEYGAGARPR